MKPTHVTYIKLPQYLASYFRSVMNIAHDEPLYLPAWENRKYFLPFLKENKSLFRNPSKNKNGYYKDANSYTEYAYRLAQSQDIKSISYTDKIPTPKECNSLQPFRLPDVIHLPKSKDKPERDVQSHQYFELHDTAVTEIRAYIRDLFYAELHCYILTEREYCSRLNKKFNKSLAVETWLTEQGLLTDDPAERHRTVQSNRAQLYEYERLLTDADSIRRNHDNELKKGHLPNIQTSHRKKRIKKS